tara:strand:+ start:1250 stop:1666 length:417 start_codon:yes stop_codon:yes gene_type:complete
LRIDILDTARVLWVSERFFDFLFLRVDISKTSIDREIYTNKLLKPVQFTLLTIYNFIIYLKKNNFYFLIGVWEISAVFASNMDLCPEWWGLSKCLLRKQRFSIFVYTFHLVGSIQNAYLQTIYFFSRTLNRGILYRYN